MNSKSSTDYPDSPFQNAGWHTAGDRPARRVISRSRLCNRFKFPSRAAGRMLHLEGVLEVAAAYWLEALVAQGIVVSYRPQPGILEMRWSDQQKRYFPDFFVRTASLGDWLIEAKPLARAALEQLRAKHCMVRKAAASCGFEFAVWSEHPLLRQPELTELKRSYHARVAHDSRQFCHRVFAEKTIKEICDDFFTHQ